MVTTDRMMLGRGHSKDAGLRGEVRYTLLPEFREELIDSGGEQPRASRRQSHVMAIKHVRPQLQWLEGKAFQFTSATIILLNALVIGVETDYPEWQGWDYVEDLFLLYFGTEMLLRMVAYTPRIYFARNNPDCVWNTFDFVIVSVGALDMTWSFLKPNHSSMKFAMIFRMIRLCRVLRILKIIRFLKQLYLLAYGFVEAAIAVFWVTTLMTFVLYVCGIVLARTYGRANSEDANHEFLKERFGSVAGSMLTLFELMSSPDLGAYHEVMQNHPPLLPFLVSFIIFGSFGMLALLTGVISESMFEKNQLRMQEERLELSKQREAFRENSRALFDTMNKSDDGGIDEQELRRRQEDVVDLIEEGGVSLSELELRQLFTALDSNASEHVDRLEFEAGLVQMCESVRPMAIMQLNNLVHRCLLLVDGCNHRMNDHFAQLDKKMNDISQTCGLILTSATTAPTTSPSPVPLPTDVSAKQGITAAAEAPEVTSPLPSSAPLGVAQEAGTADQASRGQPPPSTCEQGQRPLQTKAAAGPSGLVDRDVTLLGIENCLVASPVLSLSVCTSASAILAEFRGRLEDMAGRLRVELQHAEAARQHMEELLAVSAHEAATLDLNNPRFSKHVTFISPPRSEEDSTSMASLRIQSDATPETAAANLAPGC